MKRIVFTISVMIFLGSSAATAAPLLSPWDEHPVKVRAESYACSLPDVLPKDIVLFDYYSDSKHSIKDPTRYAAYQKAAEAFRIANDLAEKAADSFQDDGNKGAADCVLKMLLLQAHAEAMTGSMSSNQAYYVQGWSVGALSVTWLKVRGAEPGTAEERALVTNWLQRVAGSTKDYFTARALKNTSDGVNNHFYWAGFAVMAAGVAADNREYFDWGVSTYDVALSQIQPDGTLPLEMARGQKALHYHLFALAPLVTMAEFGAANGIDLYGRDKDALSRLIVRSVAGLADNQYFATKAGVAQDTPAKGKLSGGDILWLKPYLRRHPNAEMSRMLASASDKGQEYLGGLPPS
jgi:poly(beta-D-mannuronate) lyase